MSAEKEKPRTNPKAEKIRRTISMASIQTNRRELTESRGGDD